MLQNPAAGLREFDLNLACFALQCAVQEAIASLGAAGKVDDMDLDEADATEKKSKKSKKKRSAEDTETGQCSL